MGIAYSTSWGSCYQGLAEEILTTPDFCQYEGKIDLIFTSPPFPLNRKKKYGNLQGQAWVDRSVGVLVRRVWQGRSYEGDR